MDTLKSTENAAGISAEIKSSKTQNSKPLSSTPYKYSVLRKESPHKQLILSLDSLFDDLSELINTKVGSDLQILTPEKVISIFVDTKCVNEKNDKDMELLITKVIPQLQDPSDPSRGIPRSMILYYFAAFFLIRKIHNPDEIPTDLRPIVERYTLPRLLILAQKTIQLKYNYIANSLGRKYIPGETNLIFKPTINDNARNLSSAYWSKLSVDSDDVYRRLSAWTEHKNKMHEDTVKRIQGKEVTDLTFIPATNRMPAKKEKSTNEQEECTKQPSQSKREIEDAAAARLYEQGIARHIKIQKMHSENISNTARRELEQCTFSPQIRELKHSVTSGAGLVSSTDSHRRSIISAIARMRQSRGSETTGNTPESRYSSQTKKECHLATQGPKKLSCSLMKSLDLMVSPSPPCSGSFNLRSVTPSAYNSLSYRQVHANFDQHEVIQDLSAAAIITEEKYRYKTPTLVSNQNFCQRSFSGLTRSSIQERSHAHTPRADVLSRNYSRSPSRTLSPSRFVNDSRK